MNTSWSRFNVIVDRAGLCLPLPADRLLVIFSFNESKLVTVWGGFLDQVVRRCFRTRA
jgi:hypothetical protein